MINMVSEGWSINGVDGRSTLKGEGGRRTERKAQTE